MSCLRYSDGLVGVSDAEYNAHYDRMVTDLNRLLDTGSVKRGLVVSVDTVPVLFLQESPIVRGTWLDRYVVELAEFGALLQGKGL